MNTKPGFLDKIADELLSMPAGSTLVILPTRRAASELRLLIARRYAKPAMLPVIVGVSDFNERVAALPVVSKEILLLELFGIYQQHDSTENLASFASWGEQLLKDFNEIDLQMVFANDLFRRMADIREMEMEFAPSDDRDNFYRFWQELSGKDVTPLQQQFLSYWEKLPFVYHDFRNHLQQRGFAYEGLSLRLAAESKELPDWLQRFTHLVYAGFYALNRVEEKFLEQIGKQKKLLVLKDADQWYVGNSQREAGMFFRRGYMADSSIGWTGSELLENKKEYLTTGVSGSTAMSREIASRIADQLEKDPESAIHTVVILPDETLLPSFLNFCHSLAVPVNPSMGFPLSQHVLWQVLETLKMVRASFPVTDDLSVAQRKKEVLLSNPYINKLAKSAATAGDNHAWHSLQTRILEKNFIGPEIDVQLLSDLLFAVQPLLEGFAAQAAAAFIRETENAANSLLPYHALMGADAWWKIFTDILRPLRIPFKADREKGVHIMGFLETRVLDFPNVYIASMNEGTFPSSAVSTSLIPYVIRKYYGLPCREEQEAVTAYHFYRLLQRAEVINFYYDNSPDAMGGGEKSRFLLQLYHELIPAQNSPSVRYFQVTNPPAPVIGHPISITKSDAIIRELEKKFVVGEDSKALSASAINTYIHCSLKFYLEQVAKIRSDDDITKTLEANIFGKVLHRTMELLYQNHKLLDVETIRGLQKRSDQVVEEAISEIYRQGTLYGHDLLMQEVIKKLVWQILENDINEAPLFIVSVEQNFDRKIIVGDRTIKLKGVIDRLDERNGELRVLDYKTGQDDAKLPKDPLNVFSDPKNKTAFQLLFYLYLVQPIKEGRKIKAGIFKLSRENQFTYLKTDDEALFELTDFENNFKKLVAEIFDQTKPFEQTTDTRRCKYCDFAGLCRRN
jgi:CRISPR/Cas system-associated exonuclease Cas4 (RecB family)